MREFRPTPRAGESVRWSPWQNWIWTCHCGFEATCLEDVGGHRVWHRDKPDRIDPPKETPQDD